MNDPRSAGRPAPSRSRTRSAGQPAPAGSRPRPSRAQRRRRRQQMRRFKLFLLIHQILLVLAALAIGYFIGAGRAEAAIPAGTQPPAPAIRQPADTRPPEPPQETTQFLAPEDPGDTTPPQILGVNKLSLFLGGTVAYRSGILVTDDTDAAPKLTVDSSQVNLSAPGTYPVIYTATDASGNATSVETTVTVAQAPESYVDEAIIKEKADKILAKILKEGQTLEEQINTIYDYIENHHYYIADFDKSDYMQAAYLMMTENRGDCFGYYALARLFFERLGIPNLTVTRMPNEVRTTNHWWNMVSLDGGETWYHYDSTPHLTYPTRTCLITDADLEDFNQLMPNYYYFDHNSFPKTPVE